MAVKLVKPSANCRTVFLPKTASTALTANTAVVLGSGKLIAVADGAGGEAIEGIIQRTVASTDSDYASETLVPVLVDKQGEWEIDMSSSTNTLTPGEYLDWNDSGTVHVTNSTYDSVRTLRKGTNASKGRFQIVRWSESDAPAVDA